MKKSSAMVTADNPEPKSSLRERVLRLITEKRITPDDPTHDVLLGEVEIVEEVERLLRIGPEVMRKTIANTQAEGIAKIHQYLTAIQETAVKQQEHTIAQSVARLLQHSRSQEELVSWQRVALPTCLTVLSVMTCSIGTGWFLSTQFQPKLSPIAPGVAVKLTEQQVQDLKLAATPEGRFAINIVAYNPGKVQDCLSSQAEVLKATIQVPTLGKVEYGACLLWVVPTEQRKFAP
jgi:hypothetical protein